MDSPEEPAPQTALSQVAWPVRTERLVVRPMRVEDAGTVHAYRRHPEVDAWLSGYPGEADTFTAWFTRPHRLARTLAVELDDRLVGDLYLAVRDGWAQTDVAARAASVEAEVGWVLDPAYGGRGLATEAVRALLDLCFDERGLGLRRVTASCFVANEPSWRLMERVGMRREQHGLADSLHRHHGWLDGYTYALLASEWRARRVGT